MYPNAYGITSRRSHHAENCPAYAGAPTALVAYAPSIPHCNPMMKINVQITIVEEMIKIPAWRNASPKNRNTRNRKTNPMIRTQNRVISPKFPNHTRGVANINQPPPPTTRPPHRPRPRRA